MKCNLRKSSSRAQVAGESEESLMRMPFRPHDSWEKAEKCLESTKTEDGLRCRRQSAKACRQGGGEREKQRCGMNKESERERERQ